MMGHNCHNQQYMGNPPPGFDYSAYPSAQPLSATTSSSSDSMNGYLTQPQSNAMVPPYWQIPYPQAQMPIPQQQHPASFPVQQVQSQGLGLEIPNSYAYPPFPNGVGNNGQHVQTAYTQQPQGQMQPNAWGSHSVPPTATGIPYPTPAPHPMNAAPPHGQPDPRMLVMEQRAMGQRAMDQMVMEQQRQHVEMLRRDVEARQASLGVQPKPECKLEAPMKQRRRTTPEQLRILLYYFHRDVKPDTETRAEIAKLVDMTMRETQVWFQNRRSKIKTAARAAQRAAQGLSPIERRSSSRKSDSGSGDVSASSSTSPSPEKTMLQLEEEEKDDVPLALPTSSSMTSIAPRMVPSATAPESTHVPMSPRSYAAAQRLTTDDPLAPADGPAPMAPRAYRRQSIANGEAANISQLATRRKLATLGSAAMARRDSSPYASIHTISATTGAPSFGPGAGLVGSLSPSGFKVPSASLHRAVVHNASRRSSMPAPPPLVGGSATALGSPIRPRGRNTAVAAPFAMDGMDQFCDVGVLRHSSPRRTASIHNGDEENAAVAALKKLAPIGNIPENHPASSTDVAAFPTAPGSTPNDIAFPDVDLSFANHLGDFGKRAMTDEVSFSNDLDFLNTLIAGPNVEGPLPSPAFQFGAAPESTPALTSTTGSAFSSMGPPDDIYTQMQSRNRIGSIASINTFASEVSAMSSEWNGDDVQLTPDILEIPGIPMDSRRASAPDALHHSLFNMGLASASGTGNGSASTTSMPMRPSPLGPNHSVSSGHLSSSQMVPQQASSLGSPFRQNAHSDNNNLNGSHSALASPSSHHTNQAQAQAQGQGQGHSDLFSPAVITNNNQMGNMNPNMNGVGASNGNGNGIDGMRRSSTIGVGSHSSSNPHRVDAIANSSTVPTDIFGPVVGSEPDSVSVPATTSETASGSSDTEGEDAALLAFLETYHDSSISPEDWNNLLDLDFAAIGTTAATAGTSASNVGVGVSKLND